jgi:hypothetical protein
LRKVTWLASQYIYVCIGIVYLHSWWSLTSNIIRRSASCSRINGFFDVVAPLSGGDPPLSGPLDVLPSSGALLPGAVPGPGGVPPGVPKEWNNFENSIVISNNSMQSQIEVCTDSDGDQTLIK